MTVHHKRWENEKEKTKMLCLHGFGASLTSYEPCVTSLQKFGTIYAYDIIGFGRSSRPKVTELWQYSPINSAIISNELITERDVIIGHSMGCLIGIESAFMKRVKTLILIAPAVKTPKKFKLPELLRNALAILSVLLSLLISPFVLFFLRRFVVREKFWVNGLAFARGDSTKPVPQHIIDLYMKPIGWPGWDYGLLNFSRAMALYQAVAGHEVWRKLKEVADSGANVVIVHGTNDRVVPIANSRALVKAVPSIKLVEINGLGHVPHEENPLQFSQIVRSCVNGQVVRPNTENQQCSGFDDRLVVT